MRMNATRQAPLLLVLAALTSLLLLYSDSLLGLINFWWNSSDYNHGILLPFISIYLIWLKRNALAHSQISPHPIGLLLLFILSIGWLSAKTIDIQLVERLALMALFPALIWALLGNNTTKIILFPLTYLFFAAPVWDLFIIPLQNLTAIASFKLLQLTNLPILLEEHYISIPAGKFLIAKACGGLRFFIAAAAISSLYAYLNYRSLTRQLLFVFIALVGAVILNWVRVCIIIWIGQLTNMQHPLVNDHNSLGWWLFAGGLLPLFYFGAKFHEPAPKETKPDKILTKKTARTPLIISTLTSILIIAIAPAILYIADQNHTTDTSLVAPAPTAIDPWVEVSVLNNSWDPIFNGASSQLSQSYQSENSIIDLHISYYARQSQGSELINELNRLYDQNTRTITSQSTQQLRMSSNEILEIKELQLINSQQHTQIIWYWYRISDKNTTNPITAKLLELRKLIGKPHGSAVVALRTTYTDSSNLARSSLNSFLLKAYPSIKESLQ
ncbi:MAG: EpsI family protein [Gammaproteobacteria bacterium]|nr:EpsI family protein [Gammaproteobacteria bacterium]